MFQHSNITKDQCLAFYHNTIAITIAIINSANINTLNFSDKFIAVYFYFYIQLNCLKEILPQEVSISPSRRIE
jgi:hypothetical protein